MYCPQCGANNLDELKYCPRCGASLGIVAEALSGKSSDKAAALDRQVELLKKYYDGRRSTGVGVGSLLIGLVMLLLILAFNVPDNLPGVLLTALAGCALVYGAIAVIAGIAGWIESSSEMRAIHHPALQKSVAGGETPAQLAPPREYVTAPTSVPFAEPVASVTEQTTRELDDGARR